MGRRLDGRRDHRPGPLVDEGHDARDRPRTSSRRRSRASPRTRSSARGTSASPDGRRGGCRGRRSHAIARRRRGSRRAACRSHSNGPWSVSSKSLMSNSSSRSGDANSPKFDRCASPHSWTRMPVDGRGARSAAIGSAAPAVERERRDAPSARSGRGRGTRSAARALLLEERHRDPGGPRPVATSPSVSGGSRCRRRPAPTARRSSRVGRAVMGSDPSCRGGVSPPMYRACAAAPWNGRRAPSL